MAKMIPIPGRRPRRITERITDESGMRPVLLGAPSLKQKQ